MPIDPRFQKTRPNVGEAEGVAVWGPVDPPTKLGIRGTYVAVDWDLCTGCGVCLKICQPHVFEWREAFDHPVSEKKAFPARESDCGQCYKCETKCPVRAIRIIYPELTGWLAWLGWLTFLLLFVQLIGGSIYGVWFGPALGFQALFYVGWGVFVFGALLFLSSLMCFSKRGQLAEGRGVMSTTVLVESGPYGIVRHPQFLGAILMVCAFILVSQHWVFVLTGAPLVASMSIWVQEAEKHLLAKFGDDYRRYMEKVPGLNLVLGIIRRLQRRKREADADR